MPVCDICGEVKDDVKDFSHAFFVLGICEECREGYNE